MFEKVRDTVIGDVKVVFVFSDFIILVGYFGLVVKVKVVLGVIKGDYRVCFFLVKNWVYEVLVICNNLGVFE